MFRHAPVVPRVVRGLFVVALQPQVAFGDDQVFVAGQGVVAGLDHPFADVSLRVGRLRGQHDVSDLQLGRPEPVEELVDYDDGVLVDGGVHGGAGGGSDGDELGVEEVVGGDGGYHHQCFSGLGEAAPHEAS